MNITESMKKIICTTLIICGLISSSAFYPFHEVYASNSEKEILTTNSAPIYENALLSALALNYCRQSLAKILNYNDKMVLDEEYNTIINKIDLSKIQDREVISLIKELMDFLIEYKIREENKNRIIKRYESKVSNAIYSSFSNLTNVMYVGGGNPYAMAAAVVTQLGGVYADYRQNIKRYREELDEEIWKLKQNEIRELNDFEKEFLDTAWTLTKKHNMPDIWRLSNDQLKYYVNVLKDRDYERKFRNLKTITKYYDAFPPFWYYYGLTANKMNRPDKALKSFDKFLHIRRGFFREDRLYTSVLMNKIMLIDQAQDRFKVLRYLNEMREESYFDWSKNIFIALKYAEYGYHDKAKEILQFNIDNKRFLSLSTALLGKLYLEKKDEEGFTQVTEMMVKEDNIKNQDILFLFGELTEEKQLNKIKTELFNIDIDFERKAFRKDNLQIHIPIKWVLDDFRKATIAKTKRANDSKKSEKETNDFFEGYASKKSLSLEELIARYDIDDSEFIPFNPKQFKNKFDVDEDDELQYDPGKFKIIINKYGNKYPPDAFRADREKRRITYVFKKFLEYDDTVEMSGIRALNINLDSVYGNIQIQGLLNRKCKGPEYEEIKNDTFSYNRFKTVCLEMLSNVIELVKKEKIKQAKTSNEESTKQKTFMKSIFGGIGYLALSFFENTEEVSDEFETLITNLENDKRLSEPERKACFLMIIDLFTISEQSMNPEALDQYYNFIKKSNAEDIYYAYIAPAIIDDFDECNLYFVINQIKTDGGIYGITKDGVIKQKTDELKLAKD